MEVQHRWFDWIFFAIVGIPWVLGCVQLAAPDWLEPLISDRHRTPGPGDARDRRGRGDGRR